MTDDNRPRFSLALPEGSGLARFASTYLCSAFLVLLGGWLTLYGDGGKPRHYELAHVLGTQLLYAGALVGVLAGAFADRFPVTTAAAAAARRVSVRAGPVPAIGVAGHAEQGDRGHAQHHQRSKSDRP